MSDSPIAHPGINAETQAYWEAAAASRLLVKQCRACGKPHFYPRSQCPHCRSHDTEWKDASGRGRIYSYTVARRANPVTAVAYVTLDEGVTMFTNLVDCDFDALKIGQPVKVAFRKGDDGLTRPVFTTE